MDEHRQAARTATQLALEFFDAEGLLMQGTGRLLNLSETGVLVESAQRLALGQRLRFRLRFSDRSLLEVTAEVKSARSKGAVRLYGMQFEALSADDLKHLKIQLEARRHD